MFLPRNAFADNLYGPVAEASGLSTNRVLDQDNTWREDLINLNRNNRLLYFRKTKSSTLELLRPGISDLLARLANGNKGVTFWEPPGENGADPALNGSSEGGDSPLSFFVESPSEGPDRRDSGRRSSENDVPVPQPSVDT